MSLFCPYSIPASGRPRIQPSTDAQLVFVVERVSYNSQKNFVGKAGFDLGFEKH